MNTEENDELHVNEVADRLRTDLQPRCPPLRACRAEWLYPVQGYCVLAEAPGWFMIPSLEEYREYCTTPRFGACCWFRPIGAGELPDAGEAHREDQALPGNTWQPPDGVQPLPGKRLG